MTAVGQLGSVIELEQRGRTIRLTSLNQQHTYRGLLEGCPTSELNRRMIDRIVRNHERHAQPLHVIAPTEQPIPDLTDMRARPAMAMPSVRVRADFTSLDPIATSGDADGSHVTVLWFQEQWAFPIDPDVLDVLRHLDWVSVAADFRW